MAIIDGSPYLSLSDDGSEVTLHRYDTPRPWGNYLTNGDYTAIVTQMGAGFSFLYDSMYNQILYSGDLTLNEPIPGRYVYVRGRDTGRCWSPTVTPMLEAPDSFEARHAPGYSTVRTAQEGIEASLTVFVPLDRNEERWVISLRNTAGEARRLNLYTYCELVLGSLIFYRFGPIDYNLSNIARYEDDVLTIERTRHQDMNGAFSRWPHVFYAYADRPPAGVDVSKSSFVGRCRTVANSVTVSEGAFSTNLATGSQAVAAFGWEIDLDAGETQTIVLVLGVGERGKPVPVERRPGATEEMLREAKAYWRNMLESSAIDTPDEALNAETNCWTKYMSVMNCMTWRTFISLYGCSGGPSFRNVVTDLYGIMPVVPDRARDTIVKIAGYIKSDGTPSQMTPRVEMGIKGREADKSDFLLWYLLVVNDYVKETGDAAVLDVVTPYMDEGEGSISEHLVRGIQAVLDRKGPHGLPLIKYGDWNDALSSVGGEGRGESVWLAQFFYFVLGEAIELFTATGRGEEVIERYGAERSSLRECVNGCAWNGRYFVRAFTDDGSTIGDAHCDEGKVYLNPQTWAAVSEIADRGRLDTCLDVADRDLLTDKGYVLFAPPYTEKSVADLGTIAQFEPGTKENAALFSHANAFAVIAKAKHGRGREAHDLYRRFSPFSRSAADIETAGIEPYVFCQYVNSRAAARPGEGWFPWTTGTAGWALRSVTDWIVGVRAEHNGLRIDPCVPPEWESFRARRRFRGATYDIRIDNPDHVERGVRELTLDGAAVEGNLVPLPHDGGTHEVVALMGR
jgi:cellobiose phosphorylase